MKIIRTLIIAVGLAQISAVLYASSEEPSPLGHSFLILSMSLVVIGFVVWMMTKYINQYLRSIQSDARYKTAGELKDINVNKEIQKVLGNDAKAVEVAQTLTQVMNQEIDRKIEYVTMEVTKKFEVALKEKDAQHEILQEKYKETTIEKKQTDSVIRSIAEGLIVLNNKGEVMMMNPAAEKLVNAKTQDQLGKQLDASGKSEVLMSLVKSKGGPGEKEIELNSQSEETKRIVRSSTAVIENENGQTIGMVSVLTDVTKQRELDAMKSKFVASVSHELRTPIVAIRNSVSVMLSKAAGALTEDQEKFLTIAERNLKRLAGLIDDLLDLSKLEAGRMELVLAPASVRTIAMETCETLDHWAKAKDITILRILPESLPEIKCDGKRITQILTNLIGNSIKFTPKKGNVTVEAKVEIGSDAKKRMVMSVADTGVGIAKDDIPKLFNKFQQVGNERYSTDISGTGLGLAISKEFVELHGGSIWVESESGKGAKFIFTIPFE